MEKYTRTRCQPRPSFTSRLFAFCGQPAHAENLRTTFSSSREIALSKRWRHRLPQKVIEPTENTAPPDGVSKYTTSPRDRSSTFSPLILMLGDSSSSNTV